MSTNKMAAEEQKIMYLNYENLKELPEEITQKTNICGLFLKRNFLQTLVCYCVVSLKKKSYFGCFTNQNISV